MPRPYMDGMSPDDERRRQAANALEAVLVELPHDGDRLAVLAEAFGTMLAPFPAEMLPVLVAKLVEASVGFATLMAAAQARPENAPAG